MSLVAYANSNIKTLSFSVHKIDLKQSVYDWGDDLVPWSIFPSLNIVTPWLKPFLSNLFTTSDTGLVVVRAECDC